VKVLEENTLKNFPGATTTNEFTAWMAKVQARVEAGAGAFFSRRQESRRSACTTPCAMRCSVEESGYGPCSRLPRGSHRGRTGPRDPARLEIAACAVECIHAYSLVHDDLPCMDDDVLRRGKPACTSNSTRRPPSSWAIACSRSRFQLLAEHRLSDDPAVQVEMVKILAVACGSRGMAGGRRSISRAWARPSPCRSSNTCTIHKTGALIRASGRPRGALFGRALQGQLARLDHYAKCVGLAFQVVDDVLDQESSTATLGKTVGKDAANTSRRTSRARARARQRRSPRSCAKEAQAALTELRGGARRLAELADFIVLRKF